MGWSESMTQTKSLRRFAGWLLRWCQRFTPPDVSEWSEAMLAELDFVESDFRALAWATGGAGVLMRRTFIQFVTGRTESTAAGREPVHKDSVLGGGPMRNLTWGLALAGVLVFGVLFFAPTFRQALDATISSWKLILGEPLLSSRKLADLADQARAERDAETLAFVALQLPDSQKGLAMAREAVRLDSSLTWVYTVFVRRQPGARSTQELIRILQAWDSQNAFPHFLEAEQRNYALSVPNPYRREGQEKLMRDPEWLGAMNSAAHSPKYDSYFSRRVGLDREVMWRRQLLLPIVALRDIASYPSFGAEGLDLYAKALLRSGAELEAKNDLQGASDYYWTVARLGQTIRRGAENDLERMIGAGFIKRAYTRLEPLEARAGHSDLATVLSDDLGQLTIFPEGYEESSYWLGLSVGRFGSAAAAGLLLSGLALLLGGVCWVAGKWVSASVPIRLGPIIRVCVLVGAIVLPVSSLALYISYSPMAEIYKRFLWGRGPAGVEPLQTFFGFGALSLSLDQSYFLRELPWYLLLVVSACLLAFEVFRVFASRGPAHETV
jgi:hypothetical protein